jgi:transcriptional regulator with XRE-family HTH domain
MNIYAKALSAYLGGAGALNQNDLADKAGCTQAAISRYAKGKRFPDARTAERISRATDDLVPFDSWREVAAQRAGLAA